ncbi:DUF2125 domain-containing protein [Alphaproteobacteria bacterium]|nr:DUF2125 domain-containing protein [Alphaproteobacteria bacterium]MDA8779851.1 DUF2125 domain-containing protein [Alphaproteobacteria bacterium]MDA9590932.1 DUF2125 domain-containing protein [Alphaproteobacteria bacterium]MDB2393115.1 DUF2125 domain-containing protein [Alphaproteobacteria bacterium]MDB2405723.1 DUF2125 domain-containing protein [Alphaproteobacteria bacterium]
MKRLFANKRFALFAPFIALSVMALIGLGLWVLVAGRIGDELSARGLSWQSLTREGFPVRIRLTMEKPQWRDPDATTNLVWQNSGLSLTVLPFQGGHAIIDFRGAHEITGDGGRMRLAHQGNLMSAVVDGDGLNRASFEAAAPNMAAQWLGQNIGARAADMALHTRRGDKNRYDIALVSKHITLMQDDASLSLSRLDATASVPAALMDRPVQAGDVIMLTRATIQRDALSLVAKGRVKLRANGYMDGTLDLDIVNLEAFADALAEFDLIDRRDRQKLLLFGGLGAALGGDTTDRLSLPLQFKNKRVYLGGVKLGRAPRWK